MKFHSMAVAAALAASAFGAQATETFFTDFGTATGAVGALVAANGPLSASALGSFSAGALSSGDATLVIGGGTDVVARFNNATFLTLDFTLMGPATSVLVEFFASGVGNANVSINGGPVQMQAIAAPLLNPGPGGTFISKTFVGSFGAGANTLRIDNEPASGFRLDAISVTAVPEPGTYAMLLAGLAAVGFVAKRRGV